MLNFNYENQGANTYLVYQVSGEDVLDNMTLGMLTNNKIFGLSSALFTQMNDDKFIKYNISSQISATQLFYGTVNRKRLLSVFKGIADTMIALDDYMIDANMILLDLDYIFVDAATYEVSMICLPLSGGAQSVDMHDFVKNIMFSTQFDSSENCDYVTKIINFLNASPTFSLVNFKQFIDGLVANNAPSSPYVAPPVVNVPNKEKPAKKQEPVAPKAPPVAPKAPPVVPKAPVTPAVQPLSLDSDSVVVPRADGNSFAIPGAAPKAVPAGKPAADAGEKNISLLYLLQHYNKENAEAYKAQKEAKKNKSKNKGVPKVQTPPRVNNADMGFAIPGQPTPVAPMNVPTPGANKGAAVPPRAPVAPAPAPATKKAPKMPTPPPAMSQIPMFEDLDADEGTVILGATQAKPRLAPHLIRAKNDEVIAITKPLFKIGRSSELNDYNMADNKFVGHCHCHIITKGTEFYIVDDNSKNHTYVDGQMITGSVEVQIYDNCTIRLADEDFTFKTF